MKMNFFLQLFLLCYSLGMGTLFAIIIGEGIAEKYPNTKFSKFWRNNWISDKDLEK